MPTNTTPRRNINPTNTPSHPYNHDPPHQLPISFLTFEYKRKPTRWNRKDRQTTFLRSDIAIWSSSRNHQWKAVRTRRYSDFYCTWVLPRGWPDSFLKERDIKEQMYGFRTNSEEVAYSRRSNDYPLLRFEKLQRRATHLSATYQRVFRKVDANRLEHVDM